MAQQTRRRFYTPADLAVHNTSKDCWVSIFGRVFDLTELIAKNRGPLTQPIIDNAGKDLSHWFDAATGGVKTHMDTDRGLRLPHLPAGRFLHVPPTEPSADWNTDFGTPWWQSKDYTIGKLSAKTRKVYVVNALTQQRDLLECAGEETIEEIRARYMEYNAHAMSYTWKKLAEDGEKFVKLDMGRSLEANGIEDEDPAFEDLGIDDGYYYPTIHVYFNDDLTYA